MTARALGLALVLLAIGCPTNGPPAYGLNPPQLWLTLDGSELKVKLVAAAPPSF